MERTICAVLLRATKGERCLHVQAAFLDFLSFGLCTFDGRRHCILSVHYTTRPCVRYPWSCQYRYPSCAGFVVLFLLSGFPYSWWNPRPRLRRSLELLQRFALRFPCWVRFLHTLRFCTSCVSWIFLWNLFKQKHIILVLLLVEINEIFSVFVNKNISNSCQQSCCCAVKRPNSSQCIYSI